MNLNDLSILKDIIRNARESSQLRGKDRGCYRNKDPADLIDYSPLPFESMSSPQLPNLSSTRSLPSSALVYQKEKVADPRKGALSFTKLLVPLKYQHEPIASGLTMSFAQMMSGSIQTLTIYLPCGEKLDIATHPHQKIHDIIDTVLRVHEKEKLEPPLLYGKPGYYRLCLHDFDGRVDEDFPPLESCRTLSDYGVQLNEYCLVQTNILEKDQSDADTDITLTKESAKSVLINVEGRKSPIKVSNLKEDVRFRDLLLVVAKFVRLRYIHDSGTLRRINLILIFKFIHGAVRLCCTRRRARKTHGTFQLSTALSLLKLGLTVCTV